MNSILESLHKAELKRPFQKKVFISNNCIINWNVQHMSDVKYDTFLFERPHSTFIYLPIYGEREREKIISHHFKLI